MTIGSVLAAAVVAAAVVVAGGAEPAVEEPVDLMGAPACEGGSGAGGGGVRLLEDPPAGLADVSDRPLGEPASLVYGGPPVRKKWAFWNEYVPLVVGADSGEVRAVRALEQLRGRTGGVPIIGRFNGLPVSPYGAAPMLSPDGTKVAAKERRDGPRDRRPARVVVVDVVTGEATPYEIEDVGLGGSVTSLIWDADSRHFSMNGVIITDAERHGETEGWRVRVDTATGEMVELDEPLPLVLSSDGTLMLRGSGSLPGAHVWRDGSVLSTRQTDVGTSSSLGRAFAPDNSMLAGLSSSSSSGWHPYREAVFPIKEFTLVLVDVETGADLNFVDLGVQEDIHIIGWSETGLYLDVDLYEAGTAVVRVVIVDGELTHVCRVIESASDQVVLISIADAYLDEPLPAGTELRFARGVHWPTLLVMFTALPFAILAAIEIWLRRTGRTPLMQSWLGRPKRAKPLSQP